MILIFRVADPIVVNTVSNKMESCEKATVAEGSVNSLSFLQEIKLIEKQILTIKTTIKRVIRANL